MIYGLDINTENNKIYGELIEVKTNVQNTTKIGPKMLMTKIKKKISTKKILRTKNENYL